MLLWLRVRDYNTRSVEKAQGGCQSGRFRQFLVTFSSLAARRNSASARVMISYVDSLLLPLSVLSPPPSAPLRAAFAPESLSYLITSLRCTFAIFWRHSLSRVPLYACRCHGCIVNLTSEPDRQAAGTRNNNLPVDLSNCHSIARFLKISDHGRNYRY